MKIKNSTNNFIFIFFLLLSINSHSTDVIYGSTFFWWVIQIIFLYYFYKYKFVLGAINNLHQDFILKLYLLYLLVSFCAGSIIADGYWDWKMLIGNTMCLSIPIVSYKLEDKIFFQNLLHKFVFIATPFFLLYQFFIEEYDFGNFLSPFMFLLIFLSILPRKWKILCILISIYVIFSDLGARSNVIKFFVPIIFSTIFYFRKYITYKILNLFRILFLIMPIFFLVIGSLGIFNIFNPFDDNLEIIDANKNLKNETIETNLAADTRTFIYYEVFESAKFYNSWFFGMTPARGNRSESFGADDLNKRSERNGNEIGIINYFVWLGIVGVILIFLLFYYSTYYAINKSNNYFIKIMGVFVSFRWAFSWVEDINNFYTVNIFLWFCIGFCFSENFRKMNDNEMYHWVLSIFKKKY